MDRDRESQNAVYLTSAPVFQDSTADPMQYWNRDATWRASRRYVGLARVLCKPVVVVCAYCWFL